MSNIVTDDHTANLLLNRIEQLIDQTRSEIVKITDKYVDLSSYDVLMKDKNLPKLYGTTADDYSKLAFITQGIVTASMDIKELKIAIADGKTMITPMLAKQYKYRIDILLEKLQDLKEAAQLSRSGMEARVRYLSTITYSYTDKLMGNRV